MTHVVVFAGPTGFQLCAFVWTTMELVFAEATTGSLAPLVLVTATFLPILFRFVGLATGRQRHPETAQLPFSEENDKRKGKINHF
jgi:hypothetical protein